MSIQRIRIFSFFLILVLTVQAEAGKDCTGIGDAACAGLEAFVFMPADTPVINQMECVLAGAHVMMTVPNFYRLETSRFDLGSYNVLIDEPLDVREGRLHLSDRPGLGVEMDMDYLRANAVEGFAGA